MLRYTNLGLLYTYRCSSSCRHCLTNSGPSRKEKIPFKWAKEYLYQAQKIGIKTIVFTGGEPFLFYDEICSLLKICNSLGLGTQIVTNAYWADSYTRSIRLLTPLVRCGLKRIAISTDQFHSQFIKFQFVSTAIRAAKELDLDCIAVISRTKDDKVADSIRARVEKYDIKIVDMNILPGGRATNIPRCKLISTDSMPLGSCGPSLNPLITPDGRVVSCCSLSIYSPSWSPLGLGNTYLTPLSRILKRSKENFLLRYLKIWGPSKLYEELQNTNEGKNFKVRKIYYSMCELCIDLLESHSVVKALRKRLQDPEIIRKIICAEFLQEHRKSTE